METLSAKSATFERIAGMREQTLKEIMAAKEKGRKVIGHYCTYSPRELALAAGAIDVPLCGSKKGPLAAADNDLPRNLCPIVRMSYDLAATDTCPFFHFSDMVIAETTCDGKKKMYEMLGRFKHVHVMNLPQLPHLPASLRLWESEVRRLKTAIEEEMGVEITDAALRDAIHVINEESRARKDLFDLNKAKPALISGTEMLVVLSRSEFSADRRVSTAVLDQLTAEVKDLATHGHHVGNESTPRILLTGTPVGADDDKVVGLVEQCGGLVVAMETCGGYKTVDCRTNETDPRDPVLLLAEKYIAIPCSVMTPNQKRLEMVERMARDFAVDGVIDFTWLACHTYNVESYWMADLVKNRLGLPFLHLETDYSDSDTETLRVRIEAFLEMT